jgi:hypothetical protein
MIANDQERAALMAAVERFGQLRSGAVQCAFNHDMDASDKRETEAGDLLDTIRAMLAPDDAVVIPRALAERIIENTKIKAGGEWTWIELRRDKDAEALRSVLRGEATP